MQKDILNNSKIKILVCCHKKCELPKDEVFLPIQVGAAISDINLGIQRDDQVNGEPCDNISKKNKSFCELTAMYWAWKNIKKLYPDLQYIGLCHYRRFFIIKNHKFTNKVIVPKFEYYPFSVERQYKILHYSDDFETLASVIHDITPDYELSFKKTLRNGNKSTLYNMFIMPIGLFEEYCDWLFKILFACEQRIDISNYSDYQKRIFGFMSERLLYVFLKNKKCLIKKIAVRTIDIKEVSRAHKILNRLRYTLAFFISSKRIK